MDRERFDETLADPAIDHLLRRALSVDPSPEFVVRVRTRIAHEPEPSSRHWTWALATAAVVAVVVLFAVTVRDRSTPSFADSQPVLAARSLDVLAAVPELAPAPLPSQLTRAAPGRAIAVTALAAEHVEREPEVLFDPAEARALRRFLAGVREGRVDLTPLPNAVTATVALKPPDEIAIAPVGVEPLLSSDDKGVRP